MVDFNRRAFLNRTAVYAGAAALRPMAALAQSRPAAVRRPNIVVVLADDLGYGDPHCNNPEHGKIPTPNIDRLAAQGMRFTDGHSSCGVCSPSRYSLLTGRYHWRTRLQRGIVGVFEAPLIAPDRLTIAGLLKQHGYRTAAIGKWHLGWDWPIGDARTFNAAPQAGSAAPTEAQLATWRETFSQPISGGPTACGFDTYFGTDVPNWPPYCFIENDRTLGIPSAFLPAELLKPSAHLASKQGPALPEWKLNAILPALGDRACDFIQRSAAQPEPFFLYMPLTAPHTPLAVNEQWQGKSGLNTYGDFVMETDAVVGRVLDALETSGAAQNTLLVFTSDNGCAPLADVKFLEAQGHYPSGPLRGYKTSVWEGGHRVPFIVRWPGVVQAGSRCDQLAQQADLMATFADILGATLPDTAGEDSISLLPLLKGGERPVRESAVNVSSFGVCAIRKGPWKLIFGPDAETRGAAGGNPPVQLYNLVEDLAESRNLAREKPETVAQLTALMEQLVNAGRSAPGAPMKNDVEVNWRQFMTERTTPAKKAKAKAVKAKAKTAVEGETE